MHRVFISDLHLEDPTQQNFLRFAELLKAESAVADEIYILGDLVEMWVGDDDDSPLAHALAQSLRTAAAQCGVFLMHGNRDFLFGEAFADACNVTLCQDPHVTVDGLLLSHGDVLCTDDAEYQQVRAMFRSSAWQKDILQRPLSERIALGQQLRNQSKAANANKAANIMDVNAAATAQFVAEWLATDDRSTLQHNFVHGHTHRPGRHEHAWGQRWVLGAWERCGWLLRQQQDQLRLEVFTLASRYESGSPDQA